LQGSYNTAWSAASSNAFINFISLAPGGYVLQAKVIYPALAYPEQVVNIPFQVTPPWWQTKWFMFVIAIIVVAVIFTSIRLYVHRKLEKQRIALEKKQAVEKERTRIATDMHDDLGAGLSRIKFLSETISLKNQSHQPVEEDILKVRDYAHDMIDKMGEIVWALNEKNDSLSDLLSYTRVYAMEYLTQNDITCNIASPENFPSTFVTGEMRRNIFLTVKEALHNIVKHAKASSVNINMSTGDKIIISIADNGIGLDENNARPFSNGIYNMHKRIREIGGVIEIKNNNGTIVSFEVPLLA
jgi:signal transduction histidine kinase